MEEKVIACFEHESDYPKLSFYQIAEMFGLTVQTVVIMYEKWRRE
jgi:CRP-like cAMP-binding protein